MDVTIPHSHFWLQPVLRKLVLVSAIITLSVAMSQTVERPPSQSAGAAPDDAQTEVNVIRSANENVVHWTRTVLDSGDAPLEDAGGYVHLEPGLNRLDEHGQYVPSIPQFELIDEGAVIRQTQFKGAFASNLNLFGAVQILQPDGRLLQSHVLGLAYLDRATGETVILATIRDSEGLLVADDELLYPDCFEGLWADVRYIVRKDGIEQDVLLHEMPPSPALFGMDPATTVLEILTEFVQAPEPEVLPVVQQMDGDWIEVDTDLDFGAMRIGQGRAFWLDEEGRSTGQMRKVWERVSDRTLLIESIDYESLHSEMASRGMREARASGTQNARSPDRSRRLPPPPSTASTAPGPMRRVTDPAFLTAMRNHPVLVLDYVQTLNGSYSNYVFRSDWTYYISGACTFTGSATTFEGGTVIKFAPGLTSKLTVQTAISWLAGPYRPVVFTARDDQTVGEVVSGSLSQPNSNTYADIVLDFTGSTARQLDHVHVRYARSGIRFAAGTAHKVRHAQFVNCEYPIVLNGGSGTKVHNLLVTNAVEVFSGSGAEQTDVEHATIHRVGRLAASGTFSSSSKLELKNSLLVGVTNSPTGTYTPNSTFESPGGAGIFESVLAGGHYLRQDSPYRDVGTIGIDPDLRADFRRMTTDAPLVLASHLTGDITLLPRVSRDSNTPDLGYHYAALDYCAANLTITNQTLRLTNGVALAAFDVQGFTLRQGGKFISSGHPDKWNWLTRLPTVQEQPLLGVGGSIARFFSIVTTGAQPEVDLHFTGWSTLTDSNLRRVFISPAATQLAKVRALHCEFYNPYHSVYAYSSGGLFAYTNCLWWRPSISWYQENLQGYSGFTLTWFNNTVRAGSVGFTYNWNGVTWTIRDTLFDGVTLSGGSVTPAVSHNGYRGTTSLGGSNNKTVSTADFQTGPMGPFYLPPGGSDLGQLINAGSRSASAAGLYHFTTQVNGAKEAATQVDIGYHYPALASYVASDGLSSTQGAKGWYFQRTTSLQGTPSPSSPQLGIYKASGDAWTPRWEESANPQTHVWIGSDFHHPGTSVDTVLRWVSPIDGRMFLTGSAYDLSGGNGDGVRLRVRHQSANVVNWKTVADGVGASNPVAMNNLTPRAVVVGDSWYFQVNNNTGNNGGDATHWNPRVSLWDRWRMSDVDGDGIPDAVEDWNGDGSASGDWSNWQSFNSPMGLSGGSIQIFTPLK